SESAHLTLQPVLNTHECIEDWNVDLDDEDYVLRIISHELKHHQIIELINQYGYECRELK
ncbi:hypothetical protein DBR11_12545, partial [Pedobacter sp. HMWF019]|uniref:hypothetical protein n=1 Tax=Pedobacter sp. HMWF019 TaxID=2056856 RepID=UPI000D3601CA